MKRQSEKGGQTEQPRPALDIAGLAVWSVVLPGPWVFGELVGGQSATFWVGTRLLTWAALAGFWAGMALVVFGIGFVMQWAIRRLSRRTIAAPFAALAGTVVLWFALIFLLTQSSELLSPSVIALPLGLAAVALLLRFLCGMAYATSGFAGMVALLSGLAAHETAAQHFLLEGSRAEAALRVSMWWMAFVALAGVLILARPRKGYGWYRAGVIIVLALALPLGFVVTQRWPANESESNESLLLITIDALRADYCSVYSDKNPTPNIEAFARQGVVFERAYVTAPWTLPSMYSAFASDYSPLWLVEQDFEVWANSVRTAFFDLDEPTLAERYKDKGYKTAAILGNSVLEERQRFLRGYDKVHALPIQVGETRNPCEGMPLLEPLVKELWPGMGHVWPLDSTRRLTAYARRFLQEHAGDKYFLWIHYMDPHDPYNPPDAYRDMATEYAYYPHQRGKCLWDPAPKNPDWVKPERIIIQPERLYAGEVRYVDDMLQGLFDLVTPSTWVVIGADHGEEFFEHGRLSHRNTFYEETIRVPLIIAGPGIAPARITPPVSYVDLLPTLAELTGLQAPGYWRGESLVPLMKGERAEAWNRPCFAGSNDANAVPASAMVVEGDRKLILNLVDGSAELYDLSADPGEKNNLAANGVPPEAEHLKRMAAEWAEEVTESHQRSKAESPPDAEQSEELREKFEALGYL